jgi:SAM-dependent methyltransferase
MEAQRTNAEQALAWAGRAGAHWVDNTERHDRMLAPYLAAVVEAAELSATDRVLDVGCGTGALTRSTARLAVGGQATGVDLSTRMVAAAREITDAEGPINASFEEVDAQSHDFPVDGFDTLVSRFGVMFFDDPVAAFANLHRAVRPGGRLAFACWQGFHDNEWLQVPGDAVASQVGGPADLTSAPVPVAPDRPGPFSLAEPERVRRVLTDAGYDDVTLDAIGGPMLVGSDVDDSADFLSGTQIVTGLLDGQDPDTVERAHAALREALAAHAGPHGVVLSGRAWLVTARA